MPAGAQAVSVGAVVIVVFGVFVSFVLVLDLSTAPRDGSILISNAKTLYHWLQQNVFEKLFSEPKADSLTQPLAPN